MLSCDGERLGESDAANRCDGPAWPRPGDCDVRSAAELSVYMPVAMNCWLSPWPAMACRSNVDRRQHAGVTVKVSPGLVTPLRDAVITANLAPGSRPGRWRLSWRLSAWRTPKKPHQSG